MITKKLILDINMLIGNLSLFIKDDPVPRESSDLFTKMAILIEWENFFPLSKIHLGVLIKLIHSSDEEELVGRALHLIAKTDLSIAVVECYALAFNHNPFIRELAIEFLFEECKDESILIAKLLENDNYSNIAKLAKSILDGNKNQKD